LAADAAALLVQKATVMWSVVLAATTGVAIATALGGRAACSVERRDRPQWVDLGHAEIVNEAKRSGVVQRSIERAGFKGVRVAPE
jgi:hypothetical protein